MNVPIVKFEDLVALQEKNGVDLGISLHSRTTATRMIAMIADETRKRLMKCLLDSNAKFSILIDESTTLSKKSELIVYIMSCFNTDSPIYAFLDLIELEAQTADVIVKSILKMSENFGISKDFLKKNWIAIATDGASVMLGSKSGVAKQFRDIVPSLIIWHCLCHRLELSIGDLKNDVVGINRFVAFIDKLYSLFSQSPKNTREITAVCSDLGLQFLRIGRVLNVRWIASSFVTVKAIWNSYAALHAYFSTKPDAVSLGLKKKLESAEFLQDLALFYDVLSELSMLSRMLQSRDMNVSKANHEISRTIRILESMKENPGEKTLEINEVVEDPEENVFCGVGLTITGKGKVNKNQFLQALVDRMKMRLVLLPNDDPMKEIINDIQIIDDIFPKKTDDNVGEMSVTRVARFFSLPEQDAVCDFCSRNIHSLLQRTIKKYRL